MAQYRIGEFSKITGLTVKTLRFYDEQGVLKPSCVDPENGYRYYDAELLTRARAITLLRSLEFSLTEITDLLNRSDEESFDVLDILRNQQDAIRLQIARYQRIDAKLCQLIEEEQETRQMAKHETFAVEEKTVESQLVAGIRMKGRYSDCGEPFARIGKSLGRYINGKPLLLHYDMEYREDDADFEACMPVSKSIEVEGIDIRELPAGRCVSLLHRGPYEELRTSYAKAFDYVQQKGFEIQIPSREVFLKGPGMIFRGNPKKYLTEIQLFIVE